MDNRLEILEQARRRTLLGFLVSYVAWQAPTILDDALGASIGSGMSTALTVLAATAGLVCIVYGARLVRVMRAISADPEAAEALQDERVVRWRERAQVFGFWVLVAFLIVVRLGAFFRAADAAVVAQIALLLAVVSTISWFLYLDRE